jgi:hypothetical protein
MSNGRFNSHVDQTSRHFAHHWLRPPTVDRYERFSAGKVAEPTPSTPDGVLHQSLIERLGVEIAHADPAGRDGVFVKTSCRSAKDAAPGLARFKDAYDSALARASSNPTANDKLVAMLEAGLEALRYRTPADAVVSLLRSERVMQDMLMALDYPDRFVEHLAVRPWVDLEVDLEFRGFVVDGALTALSQYNHLAFFPRLQGLRSELLNAITAFFEGNVRDPLASEYPQYVVDFAVVLDSHGAITKVWVIEINPFLETTDGCLFDWKRDREVLEGAHHQPVEFRLTAGPRAGAIAMLHPAWRDACGL